MAKRKKVMRRKDRQRRWSQNAIPLTGRGPNAAVIAEYKERVAALADTTFKDHDPPLKIVEEWKGLKHQGYNDWHRVATELPDIFHYFHGADHFFVKVCPATGKMRRCATFSSDRLQTATIYMLRGLCRFTMEFP